MSMSAVFVALHHESEYKNLVKKDKATAKGRGNLSKAPAPPDLPTHPQETPVNEQYTRQAQEMFNAAKDARIPQNVQVFAEDSVIKTREVVGKLTVVAKDNAKAVEGVMLSAQAGAKTIGEKIMNNTVANTESLFDAATAMSRARSLPEVAKLQADFMQQTMTIMSSQTKELFDLSGQIMKQTFETMNAAATKSMDQMKKAS